LPGGEILRGVAGFEIDEAEGGLAISAFGGAIVFAAMRKTAGAPHVSWVESAARNPFRKRLESVGGGKVFEEAIGWRGKDGESTGA